MKDYEFRIITSHDIPRMSSLLLGRQEREAQDFPFLRNSCAKVDKIGDKLQGLLTTGKAIGMGAFSRGELVGYLIGMIRIDTRMGRCTVIPYEGVAVAEDQPADLIRYLYAETSVLWLEHGCFTHSAFVPLADPLYKEAFLRLSFALEQVYAVLDLEEYKYFDVESQSEVRLATEEDREVMGQMSGIISKYQNAAPAFIPLLPEVLASIKEGFQSSLQDQDTTVFLAEGDGETLGFHMYETASPGIMTPDHAVELCVAGTVRSHMGRGIGKKLMNAGVNMMKEKGYHYMTTDWRVTNLASSTFWPKCGFKPVSYRMARFIDPNYAWANLKNPCVECF